MKFLIVLSLLMASSLALPSVPFLPSGYVNADTYDEFVEQVKEANALTLKSGDGSRIAGGAEAKKGEWPDFCYLNIGFYQKSQVCGCVILENGFVMTTARCVVDCTEDMAANITVNFPQLSGADAVKKISKIYIPNADNNDMSQFMTSYDKTMDTPYTIIGKANLAVIQLSSLILAADKFPSKDVRKLKGDEASATKSDWRTLHSASNNWKFRACGVGVIGNKGERAKGVVCTEVLIADDKKCLENYKPASDDASAFSDQDNQFCIYWPDRDNNICVGDFGGPVYAYKLMSDGKTNDIANQEVVCLLVGSPNVRPNSQCLDGHVTYCEMYVGPKTLNTANSAPSWANQFLPTTG